MKKDMTVGSEWKLILLFTLPIMAGSLLQQLYNTVDGIVVGNFIGDDAFAGVGTCGALGFLFLAVAMGLGIGVSVTISQYFGARRFRELNAAIDTSIILMGAIGLLFSIVGYVFTPFLLTVVLNTPEVILPYATEYFKIYSIGLLFQFIYNGIAYALRGMGDSKASLYFLMITTVLNGVLAVLFVIVFRWGVAGTAIATVIAQVVCAVLSYIYLKKRFTFENAGKHFDITAFKHILRFGIPSAVQQSIVSFGSAAMQRLINSFGENAISAYTAASRINMLMFVPIFGFQAGLAGFTGQNIGAGRFDRVKRGFRSTMFMAMCLSVAICAVGYIFAPALIKTFALEGEALEYGIDQVRFFSIVFCSFSYFMVLSGVLQGAGDIAVQSIATLSALVIRVVVGYVGVHFGFFGHEAGYVTDPIGWVAPIVITTIRYASGKWKTKGIVILTEDAGEQAEMPKFCNE